MRALVQVEQRVDCLSGEAPNSSQLPLLQQPPRPAYRPAAKINFSSMSPTTDQQALLKNARTLRPGQV